ncbi:hypothetical protein DPMN_116875 [Dreissena polymorpha]|uniref:Uncharacterized protein n=1 Tax=Dreissena polymorpha TaxID=45954 RepID=A0A9D4QV51_DREPO|nr:hypothetical protein DPMN_116719 [Dreissena polymorpha]KAH3843360.1 hypothetical protein DPMN_116875 [Dreissena polymorpha]
MMSGISLVATVPFLWHILTACGIIWNLEYTVVSKYSLQWWIECILECFRLGPRNGEFSEWCALVQLSAAVAALGLHFVGGKRPMKACYTVLLALYVVTQGRHILLRNATETFGYLYINIASYAFLVLYSDFLDNQLEKMHR